MSAKLGMFLLINVSLTIILFMFQTSITQIGLEIGEDNVTSIKGFTYADSALASFGANGQYLLNTTLEETLATVQDEENTVAEDEGNWFTDTFKTVKNWLLGATGVKYIIAVLNALPSFVSALFGTTYAVYGFAIGWLWHIMSFFALIFWIKGGGQ